ncbi:MAG TPA: non-homologous end-joining DNA ligase [Candidatus Babeliales bacterium]|nr:non-homologous end-joining DNA ligase [Candidatus Babeliales bacterium]
MKKTSSLLQLLSLDEKKLIRKQIMPSFIKPMLAQLTDNKPFTNKEWVFERKLDGERCFMYKKGKSIILKSRNDKILNKSYPEIIHALEQHALPDCILDGEIVALKKGFTSFSLLQKRFGTDETNKIIRSTVPIYYYVFDILYCDGYLLTHLPLITRKNLLKKLIPFTGRLRYVAAKSEKGIVYFKQACKARWEGLIAKKKNGAYLSQRTPSWTKLKCVNEQELVIGGYTESTSSRLNFGALLLGYYDKGKLHYAGKVGTGFDATIQKELGAQFKKYEIKKNPFTNYDDSLIGVHWVKPILVCEIQFEEWTHGNKLRHASYLGLRDDKKAKEVRKE